MHSSVNVCVRADLRDSLKPVLVAAATRIGGLVPMHATYSWPRKQASEDWLWSVGNSPLNVLSDRVSFSDVQVDAVHRNYVASALRASTLAVNEAVGRLSEIRTLPRQSFAAHSLAPYFSRVAEDYSAIYDEWMRILTLTGNLEFDKAVALFPTLQRLTDEMTTSALHIEQHMLSVQCSRPVVHKPHAAKPTAAQPATSRTPAPSRPQPVEKSHEELHVHPDERASWLPWEYVVIPLAAGCFFGVAAKLRGSTTAKPKFN